MKKTYKQHLNQALAERDTSISQFLFGHHTSNIRECMIEPSPFLPLIGYLIVFSLLFLV
jgi:hypothetical protein